MTPIIPWEWVMAITHITATATILITILPGVIGISITARITTITGAEAQALPAVRGAVLQAADLPVRLPIRE